MRQPSGTLFGRLNPQIQSFYAYGDWRTAVAFNDKYAGECGPEQLEVLSTDLSRLGEELATRIELEDHLIGAKLRG